MERSHITLLGGGFLILLILSGIISLQVQSIVPLAGFGIAATLSIGGLVYVSHNSS